MVLGVKLSDSWVVVELTPKGEKEHPEEIRKAIGRLLRGSEVYVPAIETQVGDDLSVHYLMHGYVFARHDRDDKAFFKLEGTKYIQSVLTKPGTSGYSRQVDTVPNSHIEDMQEQLRAEINQGIGVGDTVLICSGPYKNLEATVITEIHEEKSVQVFVKLRSKEAILTLKRSTLKVVDRAPLSGYFARLGYLRAWSAMAIKVFGYKQSVRVLKELHARFDTLATWQRSGSLLYSFVFAPSGDIGLIQETYGKLSRIVRWTEKGSRLYSFHAADKILPEATLAEIQAKYIELEWLQGVEDRIRGLGQSVEAIARDIARSRKGAGDMVENILIDGHNLAFRCLYAPGMSELKDRQGRPTGMILGFLRSLASLKKRYPEATFWVTWDGSNQRRKSVFPSYKGNRKSHTEASEDGSEAWDPLRFLKELLPNLGVRQAWNPQEEADDVLGTLVRGDLADQQNLILTTDRDLLQLVTESTRVLVPATGSRKEIFFDIEAVKHAMGVPPEQIVQLRSFFGDTSDNIPGVPRVPKKILTKLVVAHGSVNGVYASGLAGVSKGHYERLRYAEAQVRINADLMSIVDVEVAKIDSDVDADAATQKLLHLDIKPEPVLEVFLPAQV